MRYLVSIIPTMGERVDKNYQADSYTLRLEDGVYKIDFTSDSEVTALVRIPGGFAFTICEL